MEARRNRIDTTVYSSEEETIVNGVFTAKDGNRTLCALYHEKEEPETGNLEFPIAKQVAPISTDFNVKEAIAYLRKLEGINEIELFVKKDKRITVKKAASSRINAVKG